MPYSSTTVRHLSRAFAALTAIMVAGGVCAEDLKISIKGHAFVPPNLTIAAGKRVKVLVKNENMLPAEFEGKDFPTEKVLPGKTELPVYIGPLDVGTYHFFNEFDPGVSGELIVK